tara:strand:- start:521 stop:1054 length:534 start_codon:yes stop_codon:yes gene_type:complete
MVGARTGVAEAIGTFTVGVTLVLVGFVRTFDRGSLDANIMVIPASVRASDIHNPSRAISSCTTSNAIASLAAATHIKTSRMYVSSIVASRIMVGSIKRCGRTHTVHSDSMKSAMCIIQEKGHAHEKIIRILCVNKAKKVGNRSMRYIDHTWKISNNAMMPANVIVAIFAGVCCTHPV